MSSISTRNRTAESPERVSLAPLGDTSTFADRAYRALREVIVSLDVYGQPGEMRLDERRLAQDLGISRTPVREAMAQLEREGFVRSIPRRGVYVGRKTNGEEDRADRSIRDHMNIIQALENRETDRAETLVRQHALGLAEHVAR